MRVAAIVACLVILAGCAGPPPEVVDETPIDPCAGAGVCSQDPLVTDDGRDLRTGLTAEDRLDAPVWVVGDVFEQHIFLGERDASGTHIQTVVIEARNGYTIATTDEASARSEAVYDLPVLGTIGVDLETSGFGSDWSWMYEFPISHGKTWTGSVEQLLNWNTYNFTDHALTMTATYEARIDTPLGFYPGFWIDAIDQNGERLARYNYVPAIGWFSHFWIYDLDAGGDTIMFHAMSMGTSKDYTGPYLVAHAETVLDHFHGVFPDPSGPVQGDPAPQAFNVAESDRLMGFIVPIAVVGRTEVTLTDPTGTAASYSYQQLGPAGPGFTVIFIDEEPVPGAWQMRGVGVGVATGVYIWLSTVTVTETVL